ncbi:phosphotransferase [Pseudonocardia sp. NPDC049635]|uniref:phosphotransferase n=1 Tax=Pseudonocardia sp. NPDC049635 TaxID=3155506 RepID=UPI0034001B80
MSDHSARTAAAVDAAVGAARGLGLTVTDAAVLHDLFSVVVHLAPAPVVARMPVVLPHSTTPEILAGRQQAELDVTGWLAARGTPVIPPSPLVAREPVRRNGFSMTFWQLTEEDQSSEPDYAANSERVADLHAALHGYPGPLPFLTSDEPRHVPEALDQLAERGDLLTGDDLERARREWRALAPLVHSRAAFERAFPGVEVQPVHGDSPPANTFAGTDGPLFADFELVTTGPVEWDLATLGPEMRSAYERGARRAGLRPLDDDVVAFVDTVGTLRAIATLALTPQLPVLADYLVPVLEQWRAAG